MKYFILTLLTLSSLYAKDFSIILDKPFNDVLFDVIEDYDRTISAVGFSKSFPNKQAESTTYTNAFDYLSSISSKHGSQMHLVKVDKYANILIDQHANLSKYNEAVALVKTPQNGYFIGGYTLDGSMLISRLNANGEIIFTKIFGTQNHDTLNKIISLKDGGVLAIGTSATSRSSVDNMFETGLGLNDIYIARFSKHGEKLWGKKYGTEFDDKGIDAVEAQDGSLIIVGITESNESKNVTLLRTTGNGDKIWLYHDKEKKNLTPHRLIKLRDNNFLLSASKQNEMNKEQVHLIKFNLHNKILIEQETNTAYSSILKDIKEFSDGGIIGVGSVQDVYNTDALVMLFDSKLNMTNQEHFGSQNYDEFNALTILHNSQVAAAGINTSDNSQESNMWIVKLNRDGTIAQVSTRVENYFKQLREIFKEEIAAEKIIIKEDLSIELSAKGLLFAQGIYQLTQEQKSFIEIFAKKLLPFLYANKDFISTLEVNGHTSSEWGAANFTNNYLKNEKLSMNRSFSTLSYMFSKQSHTTQVWLTEVLKGSGLAYSKRIRFDNEVENKEESRRVSFRIVLK